MKKITPVTLFDNGQNIGKNNQSKSIETIELGNRVNIFYL